MSSSSHLRIKHLILTHTPNDISCFQHSSRAPSSSSGKGENGKDHLQEDHHRDWYIVCCCSPGTPDLVWYGILSCSHYKSIQSNWTCPTFLIQESGWSVIPSWIQTMDSGYHLLYFSGHLFTTETCQENITHDTCYRESDMCPPVWVHIRILEWNTGSFPHDISTDRQSLEYHPDISLRISLCY